jgi:aspartyl-tRNA(Asn)/glutamyl-tRNA(Gln) amidotransferase subunit B
MRSKEEANDYRYFPEPDLVPLAPSAEFIERARAALGALPAERRQRLVELFNGDAPPLEAIATVVELGLDELVLAAYDHGADLRLALARAANEAAARPAAALALDPAAFASLVRLEADGSLSATQSKAVLAELLEHGGDPAAIAASLGFEALEDDALQGVLGEIIEANPAEWARFLDGDEKVAQFFLGLVMRATRGRANGKVVAAALAERKTS